MVRFFNFILIFIIALSFKLIGHSINYSMEEKKTSQVSINIGTQMSGIKDEDFVFSNYSPLFSVNFERMLSNYFGYKIGYKGVYFNYIGDKVKHYYFFIHLSGIIDVSKMVSDKNTLRSWGFAFYGGPGFFYNFHYEKSNICSNLGGRIFYRMNSNLSFNGDVTAIIGWDIYQGNLDILPGLTIGVSYSL